ncbi:MAG: hypothetical protein JNN00_01950 [Chitinophagaceae bacterium]|nr:hypothetical protein [Chitinophagaceae bacterium]
MRNVSNVYNYSGYLQWTDKPEPNMKSKLITPLLISCFLYPLISFTQEKDSRSKDAETVNGLLAFQVGIPSKEMQAAIRNNMGNIGFGGGVAILTNPFTWGRNKRNSPLRIGGEIGYTYYGRFLSNVNINGYGGDYKTSYGILQANALVRLLPSTPAPVRPFIEILAGGNFYLSNTKENLNAIESALGIPAFDIDSYGSAGFNKGVAVGCSFGKKRHKDDGMFTLRLSYNWGSDIKYVVRNSLVYSGNTLQYSIGRAPVNYVMVQAGVGL